MSQTTERRIEVYADWQEMLQPTLIGVLYVTLLRGKEVFSFEYDSRWLASNKSLVLDPSLQLFHGRQYAADEQKNFGIFLDSSPDRWGRLIMQRREAQLAREQARPPRKLMEADYLLGVYDEHRIGALRFKTNANGPFLDNDRNYAAPPWTSLRELEHASLELEKADANKQKDYAKWLMMLIAPGGSLGGARPKASVIDKKRHPWIAKFPSQNDSYDVGAWEMLVNNLAQRAGIIVARSQIKKLNSRYHTFLSKRFDRNNQGKRIHFASAMTLLQHTDGADASNGVSYLELAEFIIRNSVQPTEDLEQLWRRIVFYMCVSNVDDHLRNHGFIFQPSHGWLLSPAFDINPEPAGTGLKLNVSTIDNAQDLQLAKEVCEYFRVKPPVADRIIQQITHVVSQWRDEAIALGISASEQEYMENAFYLAIALNR